MSFGMDNLMESIYGDPSKRGSYVDPQANKPAKGNSASMTGLMQVVGEMYTGDNQNLSTNQQQTSQASVSDANRRTRDGGNQQQTQQQSSPATADQLKAEFCQWVKKFDQAVSTTDSKDRQAGDHLWKTVVQHVDDCWKNFTDKGQVPQ